MNKADLRKSIRQQRRSLTAKQQVEASQHILPHIENLSSFKQARHIAVYLAFDGELDAKALIELAKRQDKKVCLPIIHPFNPEHLLFIHFESEKQLVANKFGILEPRPESFRVVPVDQLDIIFTPLVAFDDKLNRLGMGGGFYDRTLASLSPHTTLLGLAHNCQKVAQLKCESWDVPLQGIITPDRFYR